jgi:membrane protease YdiL (CAAX protease family)
LLGLALAVLPIALLVRTGAEATPVERAWLLCATAGSALAAYALRSQGRQAFRHAVPPTAAAVTIGVAIMSAAAVTMGHSISVHLEQATDFFRDLWLYFCVGFVLEEVTFRGMVDAHVHPDARSAGVNAWTSALFVSALWGLWHLPIVASGWSSALQVLPGLLLVHVAIGIPLSFSWRRGGTLVLPALAHAIIDAYRNVVTQ